jgi:hypothetical protein
MLLVLTRLQKETALGRQDVAQVLAQVQAPVMPLQLETETIQDLDRAQALVEMAMAQAPVTDLGQEMVLGLVQDLAMGQALETVLGLVPLLTLQARPVTAPALGQALALAQALVAPVIVPILGLALAQAQALAQALA